MDRSFLSRPEVIAASRQFVCVRLATYEDPDEGAFLKAFLVTRSGDLENTVFTLLAPDGKRRLARASRSTRSLFEDSRDMADTLSRVGKQYANAQPADGQVPELPKLANVRLAVNVAACDNQPLVVVYSPQAPTRRDLEGRLAALAWAEPFLGRFVYATASRAGELAGLEGARPEAGVLVVQPDRFGQKGKVLAQFGVGASRDALAACLKQGMESHQRAQQSFASHVREGHRLGVFWETAIPVTDPMELRARERGRAKGPGGG